MNLEVTDKNLYLLLPGKVSRVCKSMPTNITYHC